MQYTDDTAMTLVLARHLVSTGGIIQEDRLATEFAVEWQAEPHRGYGAAPPGMFRAILRGGEWWSVAQSAFNGTGSWGNGGAMRVAPVALIPGPLAHRVRLARRQASVTHAHPLAQDGAALQCAAIVQAEATAGENLDAERFLATLDAHVTTAEFREALAGIKAVARGGPSPPEIAAQLGSDVTALGSVPTAIALFLQRPDDMEKALVSAVHAGGDTDTIASMLGALVGARVGEAGLPARVMRRLEAREQMVSLADQLSELG